MGKRTDWTADQLEEAVRAAGGNLTAAARELNKAYKPDSRVTRQNLQSWIDDTAELTELSDAADLSRKLTTARLNLSAARRSLKATESAIISKDTILEEIKDAVQCASLKPIRKFWPKQPNGKALTIELLFSDLQIGKLMDDYDSKVAFRRVNEYVDVALDRIRQYQTLGYRIEKIVFAMLGDIIESDKKHGLQSARACDIGTADQLKLSVELIFNNILRRLTEVGVPMDVICITGNHDWDGHGLFMFNPGKEQLSWPMYNAIKLAAELSEMDAKFYIPTGAFHVHEIYGSRVLYEHGVGVSAGYTQMKNHLAKRTDQLKKYITLFRMGDKHNISRFNNDRLVVNGAFFGDSRSGEEYSGIAGYDGEPAQLMFAHVKRKDDRRTTIFDSIAIQLGHIT